MHRILTILYSQYPQLTPSALQNVLGSIEISVSRKTGRVKYIYDAEQLLFSLRTSDGYLLPTYLAAERLLAEGYRENVIQVTDEAAPFVAEGKSAFCKYVHWASNEIQTGTDVFVTDMAGNLLAVGSAVQPGYAMIELNSGIAVKVKHYNK